MRKGILRWIVGLTALFMLFALAGCSSNDNKVTVLKTSETGQLEEVPEGELEQSGGKENSQGSDASGASGQSDDSSQSGGATASGSNDIVVEHDAQTPDQNVPVGTNEEKTITVTIEGKDGANKTEELTTTAGDLLSALKENGLASDDDPENSGYITTVDGYTADVDSGEWWSLTRNGEMLTGSAAQTPIQDGEAYGFKLESLTN